MTRNCRNCQEEGNIFTFPMHSIYQTTQQGTKTRSHLLNHIKLDEELSRDELIQRSGLSYDQVRRQCRNLSIEGRLESRMRAGKRYYALRKNFIVPLGTFAIVFGFGWSVPMDDDLGTNHVQTDYSLVTRSRHQTS